jgi:hypothetical protein
MELGLKGSLQLPDIDTAVWTREIADFIDPNGGDMHGYMVGFDNQERVVLGRKSVVHVA